MNVVIQCAARKRKDAGAWRTSDGKAVTFIASPGSASHSDNFLYATPDDLSAEGVSWRVLVSRYNKVPGKNPLKLYPAYRLYQSKWYTAAVERFGVEKVFILSAGWGLIRADFLTPRYDITFSLSADPQFRRTKADHYDDYCMLPSNDEPIIFFGGKDYLGLFASLTRHAPGKRIAFYNSSERPQATGCTLHRYKTTTRTNWHYQCLKAFIERPVI